MTTKPYIVGITGGSASGKTSFLNDLIGAFTPEQVCLISQDNYYLPRHNIPTDPNGVHNFDLPETIDHVRFGEHVHHLKAGHVVEQVEYTFNNPTITPKLLTFQPAPIIVVEGLFAFHFPEVACELDLKVFIDAKNKIKLTRRIKRDAEERGYDLADVLYRWKHHVKPSFEEYVKPYRAEADLVVPNNRHYQKGLEVLVGFLKTKLI